MWVFFCIRFFFINLQVLWSINSNVELSFHSAIDQLVYDGYLLYAVRFNFLAYNFIFFVLSFSSFYNKVIKMNHTALALFIVSDILFITYCLTKKICKNLPINLV